MEKNLNRRILENSAILLIDMQEKLINAMPESINAVIKQQKILLTAIELLNLKLIVTEQYPKGLGNTIQPLKNILQQKTKIFEKNTFSCLGSSEVKNHLNNSNIKTVILAGIETHVCVLQTALDCIDEGYQVIMLKDAVNSRHTIDKETAFETAASNGVIFMTVESLLFMLMKDSKHEAFRKVSKLLVS